MSLDYIKTISMMVADEDMYAEEDVIEDRVLNAMDLVIKKIDLTRKDIDM